MNEHPQISSIKGLSPVFSVDPRGDRFCTTMPQGLRNLLDLGARLAGNRDALVGLYVTEDAEQDYQPDPAQHGRVVALVRVKPMPPGLSARNFPSGCLEFRGGQLVDRWPIGWPCELVFFSPHGGPMLRDAVWLALKVHPYANFAGQFLHGPIDLRGKAPLSDRLMTEIRAVIARDPAAQLRPF